MTARAKRIYIKTLDGKYTGISPTAIAGKTGDDRFPVYADRTAGNGWESAVATERGTKGEVDVRYEAANRQFTVTPEGARQSRDAGAVGGWETFFATVQPDGTELLYRIEGGKLVAVFQIEEIK